MSTLLSKILAPGALSTVFQPIYKIDGPAPVPVILECLTRGPESTNAKHAGVLFEYAQLKGAEPVVDRACIAAALTAMPTVQGTHRFSLNIFAATLVRDSQFPHWIAETVRRLDLNPSNLVFEIVEHGEASDTEAFLTALRTLRSLGSEVALDDVGLAHSNLARIIECEPEFLKIDQCIIRNCHTDKRRQALLRALSGLAKDLGSRLIAEGIEVQAELEAIRSFGIELFQGFLLSKPMTAARISALLGVPKLPSLPASIPALAISVKLG